jgi:hypothetical protein
LLAIGMATAVSGQKPKGPSVSIPISQRAELKKRLVAYTTAYRNKDWSSLYDLVSEEDKNSLIGGPKLSRDEFIRDMQGTDDSGLLIKFTPVRTEVADTLLGYNVYGCGVVPFGNQKLKRIVALRAVHEDDGWHFTNWDYPGPEPCSELSNPAWKPTWPLGRLDEPMRQVLCELVTCEI